jgi:hypothetical protein
MADEMLITTVEGPKGSADIFEVVLPNTGKTIEVEYAVVFGAERTGFPSLGEAHLLANQLVGAATEEE